MLRRLSSRLSAIGAHTVGLLRLPAGRPGVPRQRLVLALGFGAAVTLFAIGGGVVAVLDRAPEPIRELPGVRRLVEIDPPTYRSSVFGLSSPLSVAVADDESYIYVVLGTGDRVVLKLRTSDGEVVAELAPPRTTPGTRKPFSVAVASSGEVYVVDRLRRAVDIFDEDGSWLGFLPPPTDSAQWSPLSVDTDREGNAYVTNSADAGPVITLYNSRGEIEETFDSIIVDGIAAAFPHGVASDDQGRLIVGDSNNARVIVLDPGTGSWRAFANLAGEAMALPRGVALDGRGLSLVVDASDHSVSAWDFANQPTARVFQFGEPGIGDGAFLFPNDVAVGGDGTIYVADRDNDRVQIWR